MASDISEDQIEAFLGECRGGALAAVREKLDENTNYAYVTGHAGYTALHWATACGHTAIVHLLLSIHPDLLERHTETGRNAVILASWYGQTDCLRLLLRAQAEVDLVNIEGVSALMRAADNGHLECVRLLCRAQADLNVTCKAGKTALQYAQDKGHEDIIAFLQKQHNFNNPSSSSSPTQVVKTLTQPYRNHHSPHAQSHTTHMNTHVNSQSSSPHFSQPLSPYQMQEQSHNNSLNSSPAVINSSHNKNNNMNNSHHNPTLGQSSSDSHWNPHHFLNDWLDRAESNRSSHPNHLNHAINNNPLPKAEVVVGELNSLQTQVNL